MKIGFKLPSNGNHLLRPAFTLVELLVVLGILGILSGIMLVSFSGGTESARAAQCLANMRNLAAAVQTYGSVNHRYPFAGSIEWMGIDESDGIANAKAMFHEVPGWISWASMGAYRNKPTSHQASSAWMTSMYSDDTEKNTYCMTNGALWRYVSGSQSTYICPAHARKSKKSNPPQWSYVMNAFFGWDTSEGSDPQGENYSHVRYGDLDRADRYLLFAEIQFEKWGVNVPTSTGSGKECDCVLQYNIDKDSKTGGANGGEGSGDESIGVNHMNGKKLYAHVAFADGHVEKLQIPNKGTLTNPEVDGTELKNLTTWLCTGEDVSFDGKQYKKLVKNNDE